MITVDVDIDIPLGYLCCIRPRFSEDSILIPVEDEYSQQETDLDWLLYHISKHNYVSDWKAQQAALLRTNHFILGLYGDTLGTVVRHNYKSTGIAVDVRNICLMYKDVKHPLWKRTANE